MRPDGRSQPAAAESGRPVCLANTVPLLWLPPVGPRQACKPGYEFPSPCSRPTRGTLRRRGAHRAGFVQRQPGGLA